MKKIVASITTLACASMMMGMVVMPAQAITAEELQVQIDALLAQLTQLQTQLAELQGVTPTVEGCTITSFDRNLSIAMTGDDVKCLQIVLNTDSVTKLADSGAGSPGNETSYFGPITKAAVIKFQEKYADEVLASWGLTSGTGYVGSTTRTKLNSLLTAEPVTPTGCDCDDWVNVACGGGDCTATQMQQTRTCTPEEGAAADVCDGVAVSQCVADASCVVAAEGALNVALADDTPAAATVPAATTTNRAANVIMTKVNLTAGDGNVTITGLKILRSGISKDAAIDTIKLYDGATKIGTSQSLGSNSKANFSNISIDVEANTTKTIDIKATMTGGSTYNGNVIALGIASADDITSNATEVTGTFPLNGNSMTLTSSVTIGTATLYDGSMGDRNDTDLTVNPTDTDIRFAQVKIMAGSAEGFIVENITAVKNGTAASADVTNIRLVNDTSGETLGTVDSLDADGRAVFSGLNVSVGKGGYIELSVVADMNNSGAGRTITFDLHDGTDYTIDVTGSTYGYGIAVTFDNFCISGGTCKQQTINRGYLTVQKSASTPATGYIAIGATQVEIAAFDFTAYGEPINVTQCQVLIDPTTGEADQFTNITGYDGDGNVLFGPKDGSTATADTDETLTFTDAFTLPIGTTVVYIKTNVASDVTAEDTVDFEIPANSVTAKGSTSGKTTYTISATSGDVPPTAARTGNTMTIQGPALKVVTAGTPAAGDVVKGAQNEVFAYFDLDASASGENVKVTQIKTLDASGASGITANTSYDEDIINLELWGDPDTTDAVSENVILETSTSTATQDTTTVLTTFTFKTPLKVKKGTTNRLTLKADVTADATAAAHRFLLGTSGSTTGHVTSAGWSTGTAITESYSGQGQQQTVQTTGKLKVVASADIPAKAMFVAGTTGNTMMEYRMYAMYEDVDVTYFYIATEGTEVDVRASIDKVKLYYDGAQIGDVNGYSLDVGGDVYVTLSAGELTVPKDTWKNLVIKVDLTDRAQLVDDADVEIGLGDYTNHDDTDWGDDSATASGKSYYMIATGAKSGTTITNDQSTGYVNSTATSAGVISASYQHFMYDGVLVVSKNSASPSGSFTGGANTEVLRLDLEAVGDDITINEMEFCVTGSETTVNGTGDLTIKNLAKTTTYATVTQSGYDAYWDTLLGASDYYPLTPGVSGGSCFSIGDSHQTGETETGKSGKNITPFSTTLQIAEGTTKTIVVLGDASRSGTTASKTLQLNLQANSSGSFDATTEGIEWENNTGTDVGDETDESVTNNLPITGGTLVY